MKGVSGAKIKEGGMIEVDNQILLKLYSLYQKELYLYLYSLCGDRHLAEDLLHETFLKALLALPDGHGNMRAWLYMVARNLFYNQQKKKSREILMDEQIYPLEEKTEKGLPEKIFEEEDRRMLYQAIRRLDIKKREIIQMQYFGGMTQKEIAAVLHITLENVRVLAYR
ncbi:RNA polymerase sigma factor, partial [Blautia wexlerae]